MPVWDVIHRLEHMQARGVEEVTAKETEGGQVRLILTREQSRSFNYEDLDDED